jgi:hypothetical protein
MTALTYIFIILLFSGGTLALSGLIVAKKPDAKQIIDKLVPFQAIIGVGLLVLAIYFLVKMGPVNMIRVLKVMPVPGIAMIGAVLSGIGLGFFFGMPQIAKWAPGQSSAEVKALELSQRLAPYTAIVGIVAVASGALMLLMELGLLKFLL